MKGNIYISIRLLVLLVCLCPPLLTAQFTDEIDLIVYCKDGSVYNGILLEETDEYFNIEVFENHRIVIAKNKIKKVKRREDYLYYRKGRTHRTEGLFFGAYGGYNFPSVEWEEDNYSRHFQILMGYQFSSRASLALSLELAEDDVYFSGFWETKVYLAPSVYGRYYLSEGGIRPFVYSQIGYGFGLELVELDPQNGFTMQNGLGLHVASKRHYKLVLSVGHYLQRAKGTNRFFDFFDNEVVVDYKYWISRPIFKIGLEFN